MDAVIITDSPNLQKAVADIHRVAYPTAEPFRNSLRDFRPQTGGASVQLVKITSVPAIGYGAGTGKIVKGFTEKGELVLEETEIPVMIPRL